MHLDILKIYIQYTYLYIYEFAIYENVKFKNNKGHFFNTLFIYIV